MENARRESRGRVGRDEREIMSEKPSSERLIVDADDALTAVFQRLNQLEKEFGVSQSRLAAYEAAAKGAHDRAIGVEMNGATWVDKQYYDTLRAAYAAAGIKNNHLQICWAACSQQLKDAVSDLNESESVLATARASERERCAKVCKAAFKHYKDNPSMFGAETCEKLILALDDAPEPITAGQESAQAEGRLNASVSPASAAPDRLKYKRKHWLIGNSNVAPEGSDSVTNALAAPDDVKEIKKMIIERFDYKMPATNEVSFKTHDLPRKTPSAIIDGHEPATPADSGLLLTDIASPFNACMFKDHCLALKAENERLRLPPDETMSKYPGCVYCMEAGTPIRPGQVCPQCGDRRPTNLEYEADKLEAEVSRLRRELEKSDPEMNNSGLGCLLFVLAVLACVAFFAFVRIAG